MPTPAFSYSDDQSDQSEMPVLAAPMMDNAAGFESRFAVADLFVLRLLNVPAAPVNQVYQGWLVADQDTMVTVGLLTPAADGILTLEWVSPTGENLLARFTGFQITLEPAGGSEMPSGKLLYAGSLSVEQIASAQRLFVTNMIEPVTPLNTPLIPGLLTQLDIAIQHIHNAQNAEAIGAADEMRVHLEHVINIFEGADSVRFQDYNGDGAAQNPGDGFGVKGYARQAAQVLGIATLADQIEADVNSLQDQALAILNGADFSQAADQLIALFHAAELLRDGPVTELYTQADKMVWFAVAPAP